MNRNGFSLIELLVTVAIIGILAAISIPAYIGQQRNAERTEAFTNLDMLRLVLEQTRADTGCYFPLAGGVCPAAGTIGADGNTRLIRDGNWTLIRAAYPRWQPGPSANMKYSYHLYSNLSLPANPPVPLAVLPPATAQTPCFTAVATAVQGTRVFSQRDIFAVDCNNNKNY